MAVELQHVCVYIYRYSVYTGVCVRVGHNISNWTASNGFRGICLVKCTRLAGVRNKCTAQSAATAKRSAFVCS